MNEHSFSARLSFKTVLMGSVLFTITLIVIAIVGGIIMRNRSIQYSDQCLRSSVLEAQSTINIIENTTDGIAHTAQEFFQSDIVIDTARYYNLLETIVESSPFILGCGFYFEPYRYDKDEYYTGIYASRDKFTGEIVYEYDDDEACAEDGWDYFSLDWYSKAKQEMTAQWTPPALENMTTYYQLMTTYTFPLRDKDGKMIGVLATDLALDWLEQQLDRIKPYEHANVVLADQDFNFICNPLSEDPFSGTMLDTPFIPGVKKMLKAEDIPDSGSISVRDGLNYSFVVFSRMENGWRMAIATPYGDAFTDLFRLWLIILSLTVISLLVLYYLNRKIIFDESKPIKEFALAAAKITDGRFDIPIPEVKTKDEMMELGNALTYMQDSVTRYIAELKTTTAEKERLASELDVARKIQAQMLSTDFPQLDGCGIWASSVPAREVGGDLYDFFVKDKSLYFIIGDVSGKGVPAALLMAITIAAFRSSCKKEQDVSELVSIINDTFCESNEDMMFVTLIAGKMNMETGEVDFCNGGHNPMVLVKADGSAEFVGAKPNIACGVFGGFNFQGQTLKLNKGERLILYTDGVTEAERGDKQQFSEPRLIEWASTHHEGSDRQILEGLTGAVTEFIEGNEPNDDVTMLTISY